MWSFGIVGIVAAIAAIATTDASAGAIAADI